MVKAIQDFYQEQVSHCYGCGRLNEHGYQIKSYWDGEQALCIFQPQPYHLAVPGFVYGGLIASIIDCHSTGTAAAAAYEAAGREMGTKPDFRYVTASLHVDYLRPTPIDAILHIAAKANEISGRKVVVSSSVIVDDVETARGLVTVVQMPAEWLTSFNSR
ncbi:MAG TPA: PaaI family thioesterase [Patescibacteria group bacterium]|nr:PaaI family thioesterase [Patescibacteria group bacterium]